MNVDLGMGFNRKESFRFDHSGVSEKCEPHATGSSSLIRGKHQVSVERHLIRRLQLLDEARQIFRDEIWRRIRRFKFCPCTDSRQDTSGPQAKWDRS